MPDDPRMHVGRRHPVRPGPAGAMPGDAPLAGPGAQTKPQIGLVLALVSISALLIALALFLLG
jgi:hypothetical protein